MPKGPPEDSKQANAETPDLTNTWEKDQKDRGYYYDDSHGYETYVPDSEDDDSDADEMGAKEKGTPTE